MHRTTSVLADPAAPVSPELLPIAIGVAALGIIVLALFLLGGYRK